MTCNRPDTGKLRFDTDSVGSGGSILASAFV